MESFVDLGGGGSSTPSKASFLQLPLPASASTAQVIPSPDAQQHSSRLALQQLLADPSSAQHSHQKDGAVVQGEISPADTETINAKIMSHPQYSALLAAYLDCQKVGAPPDVSDRLSAVAARLDARPGQGHRQHEPPRADPELDQFMEAYCNILLKFQQELARPIQEAAEFFKSVERQLDSITGKQMCLYGSFETGSLPHREMMFGLCVGTELAFPPLWIHAVVNFVGLICLFGEGIRFCMD
uniref:Uncharacterized protein n=1 Tax=Arundo donax TaxID=35708 RepID=A0A0A8Y0L7_ARUDO